MIDERKERERRELQLAKRRSAVEKRQLAEEQLPVLLATDSEESRRLISEAEKRLEPGLLDWPSENIIRKRRVNELLIDMLMRG